MDKISMHSFDYGSVEVKCNENQTNITIQLAGHAGILFADWLHRKLEADGKRYYYLSDTVAVCLNQALRSALFNHKDGE